MSRGSFARPGLILLFILWFLPQLVFADTLRISPDSGSYEIGKIFPVRVLVSSSQAINAVSGAVSFPTDKLQVVSVSKTSSILTLWVQEPSFSNSAGTVTFEGVVPNPGYSGPGGIIIAINFKVVGSGNAQVKFSSGSVLANDGSGTNILRNLYSGTFTLGAKPVTEESLTEAPPAVQAPSSSLRVTSDTHPDPEKWYAVNDASFKWTLPTSTTAVKLLLGKQSNSAPTVLYEPAISSKEIAKVDDGIWYLHLQLKGKDGWGPITHRKFKVDTHPPEDFTIKQHKSDDPTDPQPSFYFEVADIMSGVERFTIQIDDHKLETWKSSGNSTYQTPLLDPGNHSLIAKAFDAAGNSAVASIDFSIQGIAMPKITSYPHEIALNDTVLVKGTALPGITVRIKMAKSDDEEVTHDTVADYDGNFIAGIEGRKLSKGIYKLTATAVDHRGAESQPTDAKTVMVEISWVESWIGTIIKYLAIMIPLVALLFFLLFVGMKGFHKVRRTRVSLRKELRNIDNLVDKSFELLKEDITDSIRLLEKAKTKRELTKEEDEIIRRLRQNLEDAERIIRKEVSKARNHIEVY